MSMAPALAFGGFLKYWALPVSVRPSMHARSLLSRTVRWHTKQCAADTKFVATAIDGRRSFASARPRKEITSEERLTLSRGLVVIARWDGIAVMVRASGHAG